MNRWWIVGGLVLAVLVGAYLFSNSRGPVVEVALAQRGPITEFVDEQGQTRLPRTWLVTMPFQGRIEPLELTEGAAVQAGQVVAQVSPVDLQLELDNAAAAVARLEAAMRENDDVSVEGTTLLQAVNFVESMAMSVLAAEERVKSGKAKLDFVQKQYVRVRSLQEQNAAVEETVNQAELGLVQGQVDYQQDLLVLSALKAMQAATALTPTAVRQYTERKQLTRQVLEKEKVQATVQLDQARRNQDLGRLTSPIDGIVLQRYERDERQVTGGTTLLSLGRPTDLEVEADVLSQDVVRIKPQAEVHLYGPALGESGAKGYVKRVYPAGFTKISSLGIEQQRVKVILRFAPDELTRLLAHQDLGVGYRVRVRITTAHRTDAVVLPRAALFRGPTGNWQAFTVRAGRAELTNVDLGLLNDDLAEVVGGLDEGDAVILSPPASLEPGGRVAVQ